MEELDLLRYGLSFLLVLSLIGLMAIVMRRMGTPVSQGKEKRLQVVEMRALDSRRRLVLVRRDQVEHLILLADGRETVLETGIKADA